MRRIANAALGFAIAVAVLPAILISAPFAFAWWCCTETDEEAA